MQILTKSQISQDSGEIERTGQGMVVRSDGNELVPRKEIFSKETFVAVSKMLQVAFPAINREWLALLSSVLKEEGYSDQDLKKAVMKVIKEEMYNHQAPAIGKFCSQVNKVKLYTFWDIEILVHQGKDVWANYGFVHRGKKGAMFAKRADMERYGIEELKPTQLYASTATQSNDQG